MVVIVWQLDLQLPVQSVPIISKVVSSNPTYSEVYSIQHYVIKLVSDLRQIAGLPRVILLLLKVALKIITIFPKINFLQRYWNLLVSENKLRTIQDWSIVNHTAVRHINDQEIIYWHLTTAISFFIMY
jgi:hypothetical protein